MISIAGGLNRHYLRGAGHDLDCGQAGHKRSRWCLTNRAHLRKRLRLVAVHLRSSVGAPVATLLRLREGLVHLLRHATELMHASAVLEASVIDLPAVCKTEGRHQKKTHWVCLETRICDMEQFLENDLKEFIKQQAEQAVALALRPLGPQFSR